MFTKDHNLQLNCCFRTYLRTIIKLIVQHKFMNENDENVHDLIKRNMTQLNHDTNFFFFLLLYISQQLCIRLISFFLFSWILKLDFCSMVRRKMHIKSIWNIIQHTKLITKIFNVVDSNVVDRFTSLNKWFFFSFGWEIDFYWLIGWFMVYEGWNWKLNRETKGW